MREVIPLMQNWKFCFGDLPRETDTAAWEPICLPHTWNNLDGQDGGGDYRRGKGFYRRVFSLEKDEQKQYFIEFLGVNSVADVYLNGTHLGQHRGGYTRFRFELTDFLHTGENTLLVCADNSPFPDVIPLTADFTFFGGIYREVNLIVTERTHFELLDIGSDGIRLSYPNTPQVRECAELSVAAKVCSDTPEACTVRVQVLSPAPFMPCAGIGHPDFTPPKAAPQIVAEARFPVQGGKAEGMLSISSPHLWNGRRDPYLYRVVHAVSR